MRLSVYPMNKNDTLTNILLFLIIALTIGYLTQKKYDAVIFLYIFAVVLFFLSKNVALSLGLAIIFTNLLITLKYFKKVENFEGSKQKSGKGSVKERLENIKKEKKVKKE